jgi:glutathione S-transferase
MDVAKRNSFKYEDFNLDLTKNEQKSPKILAINPKGTIPFLVFNNEVLTESSAILRFLASMIESLKEYYPADPLKRHKVDTALDYCGNTLRP